jgi:hypothetical protein
MREELESQARNHRAQMTELQVGLAPPGVRLVTPGCHQLVF